MSTELAKQNVTFLPCPCCGSAFVNLCTVKYSAQTVREQEWHQDTFFYVKCGSCLLNNLGNVGFGTREEAASSWNRRVASPFLLFLVETARALPSLKGITLSSKDPMAQMHWLVALGNLKRAVAEHDAAASREG